MKYRRSATTADIDQIRQLREEMQVVTASWSGIVSEAQGEPRSVDGMSVRHDPCRRGPDHVGSSSRHIYPYAACRGSG